MRLQSMEFWVAIWTLSYRYAEHGIKNFGHSAETG